MVTRGGRVKSGAFWWRRSFFLSIYRWLRGETIVQIDGELGLVWGPGAGSRSSSFLILGKDDRQMIFLIFSFLFSPNRFSFYCFVPHLSLVKRSTI